MIPVTIDGYPLCGGSVCGGLQGEGQPQKPQKAYHTENAEHYSACWK